uniref:Uncharacterized protein n=1 Tax=Ailuropoda melanoleuca TaxID=9646 RepID=A0A7N5JY41_AILME
MVLAGPAFRVAPPSQPVGHRPAGARGRAAGTGDSGPRPETGEGRPGVSATPARLLRRKKTTDYRNMAAGPKRPPRSRKQVASCMGRWACDKTLVVDYMNFYKSFRTLTYV